MHSPFFDTFMSTYSGKWIWIPLYAAILYVTLRTYQWKITLCCVLAVALTIVITDQVCATFIRPYVARLRPAHLENEISDMVHIVNGYRGGQYGFPSCHAANTFGLAFFLWFIFRQRWLTLFMMGWALLTCYSRSYMGVHYPGDLLTGSLIGLLAAFLTYNLFRWVIGQFIVKGHRYKRVTPVHYQAIIGVGCATVVAIGLLHILK
jgi:undecaprenyl-diphosphatase